MLPSLASASAPAAFCTSNIWWTMSLKVFLISPNTVWYKEEKDNSASLPLLHFSPEACLPNAVLHSFMDLQLWAWHLHSWNLCQGLLGICGEDDGGGSEILRGSQEWYRDIYFQPKCITVTRLTPLPKTTERTNKPVKYITEVVLKKMDTRKLRAMIRKRQERNEVSHTPALAS